MLLMTGGTGFVGRAVLRVLSREEVPVRLLLRPQKSNPNLPTGEQVEVALASLRDPRGVRASLVGIRKVIHLASSESYGDERSLDDIDVEGTRILAEAAADAGVEQLVYLSHLGADRSSAFPILRGNAFAEDQIQSSGVPNTILRTALAFGPGDHFTTTFARMAKITPFILPLPGGGDTVLQPLWIADLATCLAWSLHQPGLQGETISLGGPELHSTAAIVEMVLSACQRRRRLIPLQPPVYRVWLALIRMVLRNPPISRFFTDHYAYNRTAGLDSLPQYFGLQPSRMEAKLGYLARKL